MSSPPSDPVAEELQNLRQSLAGLSRQLGELREDNRSLRERLDLSEAARSDLLAQSEHLLELLARAQSHVQQLRGKTAPPS